MPLILIFVLVLATRSFAQEYGTPDRDNPGDAMIQEYLAREAIRLETNFLGEVKTLADWERERPRYREEYFDMLGLNPLPEKTPLSASITRTIERGDYRVDCLQYQSRPGLYVTANLYSPSKTKPGERLPAILYLCGHSGRGRNGNKVAYQSHGIWFARHGYICLVVDSLQLGEIAAIHHGTYREQRWWWLSRGYTPAGVECWNGIRGIDYLSSRPDVDPERIGVTGISGGGAATFWISAADERVKVAVPVSGMGDLTSYLPNRVINGHCDCMFLYNTFQWPWTRIAGLIAPRPLLFTNSDLDPIFPMDANERVITRLERLYSLFGASDRVDACVSVGGHAYRKDIRQAAFRFFNTYLKNDPSEIQDSEVDIVSEGREGHYAIPPEELRVFPTDSDIPSDAINARVDETFVPVGRPGDPVGTRDELIAKLRRFTFHHFPERIPAAVRVSSIRAMTVLRTEGNVEIGLNGPRVRRDNPRRAVLMVGQPNIPQDLWNKEDLVSCSVDVRGTRNTAWTTKNPPNFVERSHYLLGRTVDSGRVWDIIATARYLKVEWPKSEIILAGEGAEAVLCMYAALLEPDVAKVYASNPTESLMTSGAPALLNALRVCDVADLRKMLGDRLETLP